MSNNILLGTSVLCSLDPKEKRESSIAATIRLWAVEFSIIADFNSRINDYDLPSFTLCFIKRVVICYLQTNLSVCKFTSKFKFKGHVVKVKFTDSICRNVKRQHPDNLAYVETHVFYHSHKELKLIAVVIAFIIKQPET